jgi:hypothetical protein
MNLIIKAWHGDDGKYIESVILHTAEKLTNNNLPDLGNVESYVDGVSTESWAFIFDEEYIEDLKAGAVHQKTKPELSDDKCSVVFSSEFDGISYMHAPFDSLNESLKLQVDSCFYDEIISHRGEETETEYKYYLDEDLFKES